MTLLSAINSAALLFVSLSCLFVMVKSQSYEQANYDEDYPKLDVLRGCKWEQSSLSTDGSFKSVAMSANSQYVVVGGNKGNDIHISSDYGATWNTTFLDGIFLSSAMSFNGSTIGLTCESGNFGFYGSQDAGASFPNHHVMDVPQQLSISANGSIITVAGYGTLGTWVSHNYGQTFDQVYGNAEVVAMTGSGKNQTVGAETVNSGPGLQDSIDYGQTWVPSSKQPNPIEGIQFSGLAFSPSSKNRFLSTNTYLYKSTDTGETWSIVSRENGSPFNRLKINQSGEIWSATNYTRYILWSFDSGATFINYQPSEAYCQSFIDATSSFGGNLTAITDYNVWRCVVDLPLCQYSPPTILRDIVIIHLCVEVVGYVFVDYASFSERNIDIQQC